MCVRVVCDTSVLANVVTVYASSVAIVWMCVCVCVCVCGCVCVCDYLDTALASVLCTCISM